MILSIKTLILCALVATTAARSLQNDSSASNSSEDGLCNCNWRYFKHYATKGCVVEQYDFCGCPKKFACANQTLPNPSKVCTYRNKEYKIGSKIITSDACKVCRCHDGGPPHISCITKECPQLPHVPGRNCHLIYKENKCCPTGEECLETEIESEANKTFTCEYNGKFYPYGSRIYPVDDPCQVCICNENWNGVDNSSCYQHDCMFEMNKSKMDEGCIPVYHESRCCPIEFYCPSSHNFTYSVLSDIETSQGSETSYDYCVFGGQFYEIGEELSMDNPCVICSCAVPPDFTCVHQTCPATPNNENCYPIYNSGECCPSYECMLGDSEPTEESEGCPTPLCADSSCRIETPPGHECPTCVCGEKVSELEHNELQQEVQQISQHIEQGFDEPRINSNDYSEYELQMMPIRMHDSDIQHSVLEKMILPDSESTEHFGDSSELNRNSNENISSIEENLKPKDDLESDQSTETGLINASLESQTNETEKFVQKRSDVSDAANRRFIKAFEPIHQREFTDQQMQEINKDLEREGGSIENNREDFEDELESFKNRILKSNATIINEIHDIDHAVEVPAGCPTPMCEGPWCRIGIPPGHMCPTCICRSPADNEP